MAKKVKKEQMTVVQMKISDLTPASYNPRKMTEADKRGIAASLKKFGFVDPVIVNQHPDRLNVIVGGHQRTIVAKDLGYEDVPCVFVNLDLEQERELNVRLNKNTGRFDEMKLLEHFQKDLLKEIGFKDDELSFYLSEFEEKFNQTTNDNCEMAIVPKFSEKHDAVVIISNNSIDTQFLETALAIGKAQSYKNTRTGKAMVISVEQFKEAWESK